MKKYNWWVDGDNLKDRTRAGGANALNGFDFQKAYALLRTVWLLTTKNGIVEVRYEGAQDIDLRHADEIQHYVQAKNYKSGNLTLATLHDTLAGFARDVISAKVNGCPDSSLPRFCLAATTFPVDPKALQLYRHRHLDSHVPLVAKRIKSKYRLGLTDAAVDACVRAAIERTTFETLLSLNAGADLRALASWELVRFGVPLESIDASLGRIENLLRARATLQIQDVAEVLENLPHGHPARADSAAQMLPSRKQIANHETTKSQFLRGSGPILWAAIANNLDIARKEISDIQKKLWSLIEGGGLVVVEGAAGSGKSTVTKRVAWDEHRSGRFLVLNVAFPADMKMENWKAISKFSEFCDRPLLLVVDDVWRNTTFIEDLDRNIRSRLCVLATSRPGEQPSAALTRLTVEKVTLGKLGESELSALTALTGAASSPKIPGLQSLLNTGQIFAASLVLQKGSLEEFAKSLIHPLRLADVDLFNDFLGLCVCAMHDLSVPISVLHKIKKAKILFSESARYKDLVFQTTGDDTPKLRIGHALVATAIVSESAVSAVSLSLDICEACSPHVEYERRFGIRLLLNCVSDENLHFECNGFSERIGKTLHTYSLAATYSDLHRISTVFTHMGEAKKARRYIAEATVQRICSGEDMRLAFANTGLHTYEELFDTAIQLYDGNDEASGRRKLLSTVVTMGTEEQRQRAIRLMIPWLRKQEFPQEETRLLFDLCAYSNIKLANSIKSELADYSLTPDISLDTSLAALRVITRTRDIETFKLWEKRLIAELAKVTSYTEIDMEVAIRLSRLSAQIDKMSPSPDLYEILLAMYASTSKKSTGLRLLASALLRAPNSEASRLSPIIQALKTAHARHQRLPRSVADCVGIFERRFTT